MGITKGEHLCTCVCARLPIRVSMTTRFFNSLVRVFKSKTRPSTRTAFKELESLFNNMVEEDDTTAEAEAKEEEEEEEEEEVEKDRPVPRVVVGEVEQTISGFPGPPVK